MRLFGRRNTHEDTSAPVADAILDALSTNHGLVWFDRDGNITRANEKFCEIMEYKIEDVIGISHDQLVDLSKPEAQDDTAFEDALQRGTSATSILARKTGSGKSLWISATYLPLREKDHNGSCMVKICRDVTERECAARHYRSQYDAISREQSKILFDTEGNILEANDRFLEMTGYSREEVVGKTQKMFLHEDFSGTEKHEEYWQNVLSGKLKSGVFKRFGRDNRPMWLQAVYSPVLDVNGVQTGVLKIATDVTEREEASDQVKAIARVQAVIEFTMDGVIRGANDLFLNAMGYTAEEIVGKHHSIFMPDGEADDPEYKKHWEVLRSGNFHTGQYRRKHKDGSDVWIDATYNPVFGPMGEPVKVVKFASDITPRIHAVAELRKGLEELAAGNLSVTLDEPLAPEYEQLRLDFNTTQQRLRQLVSSVVAATEEIGTGVTEMSNASDSLSKRTESQAAALEETAAAIAQMSASVKSTSDTAQNTASVVQKAKTRAGSGTSIMAEARSAMDAISESSSEISSITSVIDDIAFQTNLLALNAGVEAARAGEAGRGFAVVASEVRALAQRSSEAATQIAGLISTSSGQVSQGVDLVSKTGEALSEIEKYVAEVSDMVGNMASAAAEQSGGLSEITTAISDLDSVTQKNAAMFEETNAATQLLVGEVSSLGQLTSSFQTGDDSADRAQPPTRLAS
ncbi:PAS domain S-box protein [uncultured Roseobacter sp.]|uniref:methyl-accepting chemotaxis protein n=1 Tax=uncultured Roseobacter sp. TaxID=114847 RepID=UPI00261070A3|nr:PAS domain S-box protein [uncultured Roseobacter sp.]